MLSRVLESWIILSKLQKGVTDMADTSNLIHKQWETVQNGGSGQPGMKRLRVPGGWLYRTTEYAPGYDGTEAGENGVAVAMCFVPCVGDFN